MCHSALFKDGSILTMGQMTRVLYSVNDSTAEDVVLGSHFDRPLAKGLAAQEGVGTLRLMWQNEC